MKDIDTPPFRPPLWLRHPHLQTVWTNWAPRPVAHKRLAEGARRETMRVLDDELLLHWDDVEDPTAPIVIVLHGLTGCARSPMVVGTAALAHARGFRACRVDLRNSTAESPSRQIGHAGRSEDLHAVIAHASAAWPCAPIGVVGFSLGGNIAFKGVGEYGDRPPDALRALVGVSVPVDLADSCRSIDSRGNFHYRWYFVTRLRANVERRAGRLPELYGRVQPPRTWSIRDFDDAVVAPLGGFRGADDYYARSSCLPRLPEIRVPSLLIHAADDPFIPITPYRDPRLVQAPHVQLLETRHGGHVGFWSSRSGVDSTPFWAEHRSVEFLASRLES